MGYRYEYVGGDTLATATGIKFFGVKFRKEPEGHVWPIAGRNVKAHVIAIAIPVGSVWSGRGMPFRHVPPEIAILQLDAVRRTADPLVSVSVGRKSKGGTR